jgi:hypothetical protein
MPPKVKYLIAETHKTQNVTFVILATQGRPTRIHLRDMKFFLGY